VDVSIPTDYIADMSQRLRTYKRISSAGSEEVLNKLFAEVQDRYGRAPESVENLFNYGHLRRLAEKMRVLSVDRTPQGIAFKLSEQAKVDPEKLMDLMNSAEGVSFSPNGVLRIPINSTTESQQILDSARQILHEIRSNE
jgi:transcription-repair coupling factor (superfamily II helicase)